MSSPVTERTEAAGKRAAETVSVAADKFKNAVDSAAAAASGAAPTPELRQAAQAFSDRAKETIDAMAASVRQATDSLKEAAEIARDTAQKAGAQAGEVAGDVYDRGRQAGAQVVRRTQEQPVAALLVAAAFGAVAGYLLACSRRQA